MLNLELGLINGIYCLYEHDQIQNIIMLDSDSLVAHMAMLVTL